ncbi:hypothetical protein SAPIO_CDS7550 [Scedosporium apiospermum]|uniref:Sister chromatid cohesion protein DCC1 n=1 Tax=Pseudallescheria apiosperma TaxID=563466 RepID=A0A084G259_PSEDA|nr:uncharacterized protein SAPIO_CDS7550 [Scedosporium apiospermum]KEZ41421.1 hypothetical protein SAPIO_CDS7550 [Scedosporium apiospermum]
MSSDTAPVPTRPGIPLTHVSDSKSYRLLELPPELLALLENDSPPPLHLEPGKPHAVLVTPDKRYILTQRNTSNSLILLEPAPEGPANQKPGLNIIGTLHESIELAPEPTRKS